MSPKTSNSKRNKRASKDVPNYHHHQGKHPSIANREKDKAQKSQPSAVARPRRSLRLNLQPQFPPGPKPQQRMFTTHSNQKGNEASSPTSDAQVAPKVSAPQDNQTLGHVRVSFTRVLGQRKSKCQMNNRVGEQGRKTKPPPAVWYLPREDPAPAAHSPGALQTGKGPRDGRAPLQSTGPAAPVPSGRSARAPRGKLAAGDPAALRMQLLTAAAVPTRPRDRALPPRTPRPQGRH